MRNRGYIEFDTLEKQCWSYLRNIKTAINYFFYKRFAHNLPIFLKGKNLAEHWELPNTEIFYSKDVASGTGIVGKSYYGTLPEPSLYKKTIRLYIKPAKQYFYPKTAVQTGKG
jgi:hypothetical protein